MFSLDQLLEGRENVPFYSIFYSYFIPSMGRKTDWRLRIMTSRKENDITTKSNEAFALLCLENQWDRWLDIYDINLGKIVSRRGQKRAHCESRKMPKYTRGGVTYTKGTNTDQEPLKGWRREGIARFNELYEFVGKDRNKHPGFFHQFLEFEKEKLGNKKIRRKEPNTLPVAKHELFSDGDNTPVGTPVKESAPVLHMNRLLKEGEDENDEKNVAI